MKLKLTPFFAGLAILTTVPAHAASLTNYDEVERTITIVEGSQKSERKVASEETIENFCNNGCTLQVEKGDKLELKGKEVTAIEDGQAFIDGYTDNQSEGDGGAPETNSQANQ